jgi:hypothetical protein
MGFNQSFSQSPARSGDLFGDVISGCLAGLGIWTKPSIKPSIKAQPEAISQPSSPSNVYPMVQPLRVIRVQESNPQMAGRMVISGRMADVCAELDRLAA